MRLIKPGTSMCVGHAAVQGASKQLRQRSASITAAWGASGGFNSLKRSRNCGSSGNIAVLIETSRKSAVVQSLSRIGQELVQ
jgi:hypothetical protein